MPCLNARDGPDESARSSHRRPTRFAASVLEALSHNPAKLDEIARAAGIDVPHCAAILMELEIAGQAVTRAGGMAVDAMSP